MQTYDRKVLVYDTREHEWVRDSRYPASLPVIMYAQCLGSSTTLSFQSPAGREALTNLGRMRGTSSCGCEQLPPLPTAVSYSSYCVVGSRLFVVGGYTKVRRRQKGKSGGRFAFYSTRLQMFDATTQSWSLGPPLTQIKERFELPRRAIAYEDRFYVFVRKL